MGERLAALAEAGLPPGAQRRPRLRRGAALAAERVDGVTFTGSTATGAAIHAALGPTVGPARARRQQPRRRAGRRRPRPGGGGRGGLVLQPPARRAPADASSSPRRSTTSSSSGGAGPGLVLGPGDREGVTTGPLVTEDAVKAMAAVVEEAVADGAEVVVGGRAEGPDLEHGWFWSRRCSSGPGPACGSSTRRFGPVVGVEWVADLDEAWPGPTTRPTG